MAVPLSGFSPHIQAVIDRAKELVPAVANGRIEDALDVGIKEALSAPLSPEFYQLMEEVNKLKPGPTKHISEMFNAMRHEVRTFTQTPAFKAGERLRLGLEECEWPLPLFWDPPAPGGGAGRAPSSTNPPHDVGSSAPPAAEPPHDDGARNAQSSTKHKESDARHDPNGAREFQAPSDRYSAVKLTSKSS